jgi:hypothetical protein
MVCLLWAAMMMGPTITADGGLVWHATRNAPSGSNRVAVAMNRAGAAAVVWIEGEMGDSVAAVHRSPGGSWSPPAVLTSAGAITDAPRVAIDDAGNIAVVWRRAPTPAPERLEFSYRRAGGAWSKPVRISPLPAGPFRRILGLPDIAFKPSGQLVVSWSVTVTESSTQPVYVRTRRLDGSWTKPKALGDGRAPRVVVDSEGTVFVGFLRGRPGSDIEYDDLLVARRRDDGSWTNPRMLSDGVMAVWSFAVAADGRGNVIIAWGGDYWGGEYPEPPLPRDGTRVMAAVHRADSGWGHRLTLAKGNRSSPALAMGADGTALVTWGAFDLGIRARVRTRSGAWLPVETVVGSVGGVDAFGNQMLLYGEPSPTDPEKSRIVAVFRPRDGAWGEPAAVSGYEKYPAVNAAMGGERGAIVGWYSRGGFPTTVHYRYAGP